jgi:putative two-component system response regulator
VSLKAPSRRAGAGGIVASDDTAELVSIRRGIHGMRQLIAPPQRGTVLVVDDDVELLRSLAEQLAGQGYRILTASSAESALDLMERDTPDLVLTDVHMGAMSGIELCARLKADPRFQLTPVVVLTGASDLDARVAGLAAGADDFFAKPVESMELRTRIGVLLNVKSLVNQLDRAAGVITALGRTIEARDPYTHGHCERLAQYAVTVGQALGAPEPTLRALQLGGFLHDLGKIAIPDRILLKPGPLTPDEREQVTAHPVLGEELVRGMRTLDTVRPILRHHHERWDGSGYPDRLRGEAIPFTARIMAVVDVYDALVTERPYKPAWPREKATAALLRETEAGSWDPRVVTAFVDVLPSVPPLPDALAWD